jgi:ferredoxin
LISELVPGSVAAAADPPLQVGDAITWVVGDALKERVTGMDLESTLEAIGRVKEAVIESSGAQRLSIEVNRLVERAAIKVEIDDGSGTTRTLSALAGENLRKLLLRNQISMYDRKTKRFDQPFSTGDCAGEGICGTCLVAVKEGMDLLNEAHGDELLVTKNRPLSWRAACRVVVGADNKPGTIKIVLRPQSQYPDEVNRKSQKL